MNADSLPYTVINPTTTTSSPLLLRFGRRLFLFAIAVYALGLLAYLGLRFTLSDSLWWLAFLHIFAPFYFLPLPFVILLCWLFGARRWAVRLLPLLLIGLLLYGPRWLPRPVIAADASTLKLVTFNVLPVNPDLERIAVWLEQTDADIVLLQELGPTYSETIFERLSDLYPHTKFLSGSNSALLSRYVVTESGLISLGSWVVNRHVLNIDDKSLAVYNIHMPMPVHEQRRLILPTNNGLLNLAQRYDETYRNQNIRTLLRIIQQEGLPYIVAGDFNTSDNALIYAEMATVMQDAYRETNVGWGGTWPADIGEEGVPAFIPPLLRIDYVWHSPDLQAVTSHIGPNLQSDHLPLMVTLTQP